VSTEDSSIQQIDSGVGECWPTGCESVSATNSGSRSVSWTEPKQERAEVAANGELCRKKSAAMRRKPRIEDPTAKSTIQAFLDINDMEGISLRRKAWLLMEEPGIHPFAQRVHYCYSLLIILSVVSIVAQTLDDLSEETSDVLWGLELFFNTLFTLEVLVRIICAPQKTLLLRSMYMWMDVGAILPFYVVSVFQIDYVMANKYLELLGLLIPILRTFKITRHSTGWRILMESVIQCAEPLCVPAFLLLLMTVIASCVVFWLEKHFACNGDHCLPDEQRQMRSIPHAMWYTITTISTVGYGDVVPRSDAGRAAAFGLILVGVCYMAMPLAIIGGTFVNVWEERDRLLMREKTMRRFAEHDLSPDDLRLLFEAADQDGNGSVKLSEFVELVRAFQLGLTRGQIMKLFANVDTNYSGEITFEEFALYLFPEMDIDIPEDIMKRSSDTFSKFRLRSRIFNWWSRDKELERAGSTLTLGSCDNLASDDAPAWLGRGQRWLGPSSPSSPSGEPPTISDVQASETCSQSARSRRLSGFSLVDRVASLEAAVERMADEQHRHFKAQRRLLEDLASKVSPKLPSTQPSSLSSPRTAAAEQVPGEVAEIAS